MLHADAAVRQRLLVPCGLHGGVSGSKELGGAHRNASNADSLRVVVVDEVVRLMCAASLGGVAVAVGGSVVGDAVWVGVAGRGVGVAVGVRVLVLVGVAGAVGAPTGAKKV